MLELKDITLTIGKSDDEKNLLSEITLNLPKRHFAAIIGPSGCGKSTLLKTIAGIKAHTRGTVHWDSRDLEAEHDMEAHEIGYVPQFSIAHDLLTVEECVESSLRLRVADLTPDAVNERIDRVLASVGLEEITDRQVSLLSGGQKRRLALAMEMVSSPHLLLCDEVTSGLDPKSEDEVVKLMLLLAHAEDRIVLSVTHSLQHIKNYDSVIVLYQGVLAYHGSPEFITHYFGIERTEDLYPRLAERKAGQWQHSWHKYRAVYYAQSKLPAMEAPLLRESDEDGDKESQPEDAISPPLPAKNEVSSMAPPLAEKPSEPPEKINKHRTPSIFTQFSVLISRRWKLFFRDRGQLLLQAALLFGFPFLVVIFAYDGLPQVKSLADTASGIGDAFRHIKLEADAIKSISKTGSLVSGLIMFQVILLALMGSNNAAREIAAERHLLEKEKFAGLSPLAYIASKVAFLSVLVFAQSAWMAVFVNKIVGFQGSFPSQLFSLLLVNASVTAICLGISAWTKSAEQSSLLSIYLVGFQLPLSGAVLALPKIIAGFSQMFIASYWGWSGFIRSMESTRYYDAMTTTGIIPTEPAVGTLCILVLCAHVAMGILLAWMGAKNSRWE